MAINVTGDGSLPKWRSPHHLMNEIQIPSLYAMVRLHVFNSSVFWNVSFIQSNLLIVSIISLRKFWIFLFSIRRQGQKFKSNFFQKYVHESYMYYSISAFWSDFFIFVETLINT